MCTVSLASNQCPCCNHGRVRLIGEKHLKCDACKAQFTIFHWTSPDEDSVIYYARKHNPAIASQLGSAEFDENVDRLKEVFKNIESLYTPDIYPFACRINR